MRWIQRLLSGRRLDADLDAELRFHVDEETDRLVAGGVPPAEARRRALAAFGGLTPIREATRDARGTRWLGDLGRDARHALRMMRRSPVFTATATLSLAIGIGANAAIFSVLDALALRPLPIERPHEVVLLNRTGEAEPNMRFSYPHLGELSAAVPEATFAAMTSLTGMQVTIEDRVVLATGHLVSGGWFPLLGLEAQQGRLFGPSDDETVDGHPVAVISDRFWTREFARDASVVGRSIAVNGRSMVVVGVAPTGFHGVHVGSRVDLWAPTAMQHALRHQGSAASRGNARTSEPWLPQDDIHWLAILARVPARLDRAQVAARIDGLHRRRLEAQDAATLTADERLRQEREHVELVDGARGLSPLRDRFQASLVTLFGAVAMVLLIACANLASLLVARSAARERDYALRRSLGASRARLVRQLLTETMLLASLGGAGALAVAVAGSRGLLRLASTTSAPIPLDVPLDWRLAGFTAGVSLVSGILFGLAPARRLSGAATLPSLRHGAHSIVGRRRGRLEISRLLVAGQVALAIVLVAGALLFVRTFENLAALPAGFDRESVFAVRFEPRLAGIGAEELPPLYERMLERARAIPGVESAALAYTGLVTGSSWISGIAAEGREPVAGDTSREDIVGLDYVRTVGARLVRGRDFSPADREGAPRVALVNEAFARHSSRDRNPIGRRFGYSADRLNVEIVGVVADVRVDGLRSPVPRQVLYPLAQHPRQFLSNLYVRSIGATPGLAETIRRDVGAADHRLAIRDVVTLGELTGRTLARDRLLSTLTTLFALLAVAVAGLGLFGTISHAMARRTNEIGVRLALGATPARVRRLVLGHVVTVLAAGCALGVAAAVLMLRSIESLLYDASPADPIALGLSAGLLLLVGLVAGLLPAWRASRIDPLLAIRAE